MSDIFEEVDESLRQDRMETLWKRYQWVVYGAAALLVAAVALNEFVITPQMEKARTARALEASQIAGHATITSEDLASGKVKRLTIVPRPVSKPSGGGGSVA